MLPDFKQLKEDCEMIHYFGLGFIQIKTSQMTRYHFYDCSLPSMMQEEEVHNHRYGFRSYILQGSLCQKMYAMGRGTEYLHRYVSCEPGKPAPKSDIGLTEARLVSEHRYAAGSYYDIHHSQFHKVHATRCVTMINREVHYAKPYAEVLRKPDALEVCPFSVKVAEGELWSRVASFYK